MTDQLMTAEDAAYILGQCELAETHDDQPDDGLMRRILATYAAYQTVQGELATLRERVESGERLREAVMAAAIGRNELHIAPNGDPCVKGDKLWFGATYEHPADALIRWYDASRPQETGESRG